MKKYLEALYQEEMEKTADALRYALPMSLGASIGTTAGALATKDQENKRRNMLLGLVLGAATGAGVGHLLPGKKYVDVSRVPVSPTSSSPSSAAITMAENKTGLDSKRKQIEELVQRIQENYGNLPEGIRRQLEGG